MTRRGREFFKDNSVGMDTLHAQGTVHSEEIGAVQVSLKYNGVIILLHFTFRWL